jgi:hypothetical protein
VCDSPSLFLPSPLPSSFCLGVWECLLLRGLDEEGGHAVGGDVPVGQAPIWNGQAWESTGVMITCFFGFPVVGGWGYWPLSISACPAHFTSCLWSEDKGDRKPNFQMILCARHCIRLIYKNKYNSLLQSFFFFSSQYWGLNSEPSP